MAATEPVQTDSPTGEQAGEQAAQPLRAFVFDVANTPAHTNAKLMGGSPDADFWLELLGRDLETRMLEIHSGMGGLDTDRPARDQDS